MGKVIRAQKLGKSRRRQANSHKFKGAAAHHPLKLSNEKLVKGKVVDIIHDPVRNAPLAKVVYDNKIKVNMIAPIKLQVGQEVAYGTEAQPHVGNSLYLKNIPEGTMVYNIEATPGDGGKFARSAGNFGKVITHDESGTVVQLPSGAFKTLNSNCRANIGIVAGGGFAEKPLMKAGRRWHKTRAKGKLYPIVRGVAMNSRNHPFGGGGHPHTGKGKTVSRHAPPGRKVGSISAKKSGRGR